MNFKDDDHYKIILWASISVAAILGIFTFMVPPGIDPDPSWGLLVMNSMAKGHGFNLMISPDLDNLAHDQSEFMTWWSPGQYLLPYLFKGLFRLSTGRGVSLTIAVCNIIGLLGFFQLFKKLGFSPKISALSVAFICCQFFFVITYTFYHGGEVLLFGFAGWFIYGCLSFEKVSWQSMLFIFLAGMLGFICKSSFLWIFLAGVASMWLNLSIGKKDVLVWLKNGVLLGVPAICSLAIIYFSFLSKGPNPSSENLGWLVLPETFLFPLAAPLVAGFSIDELVGGLIYQPENPQISSLQAVIILAILTIASLALLVAVFKLIPEKKYKIALPVFYATATLFFSYMYLKQATISYEGRHFRIVGLLAIPGIIFLFDKFKAGKVVLAVVWIFFIFWGSRYYIAEYAANRKAARGITGISQILYDQPTLNCVSAYDKKLHNGIFVVTSADIGIEVVKNRLLMLDVADMSGGELDSLKCAGKCGSVDMLLPKDDVKNGVAAKLCKSFVDYHNFKTIKVSNESLLFHADN